MRKETSRKKGGRSLFEQEKKNWKFPNVGVTIVAFDLKLLRKIKWGCQLAELARRK